MARYSVSYVFGSTIGRADAVVVIDANSGDLVRHKLRHVYVTCVCAYVRTYVRTYARTYVRTYVRTYARMYVRTYVRTYDLLSEHVLLGELVRGVIH